MGGQQLFCLVRAKPPLSKGGAAKGGGGIPSGFGTARVQRMPPGTRGPGMPGPYRVAKLRIFRERHPYGRPGADLALQVNFCVVQQGNVLDDGKP